MTHCDRCGKEMTASIMSRFNTQQICMPCESKEKEHPEYARAVEVEGRAVENGNLNFQGIGLPADLQGGGA